MQDLLGALVRSLVPMALASLRSSSLSWRCTTASTSTESCRRRSLEANCGRIETSSCTVDDLSAILDLCRRGKCTILYHIPLQAYSPLCNVGEPAVNSIGDVRKAGRDFRERTIDYYQFASADLVRGTVSISCSYSISTLGRPVRWVRSGR